MIGALIVAGVVGGIVTGIIAEIPEGAVRINFSALGSDGAPGEHPEMPPGDPLGGPPWDPPRGPPPGNPLRGKLGAIS